jgi:tetratricopeptide (TPR) repeat protein
MPGIKINTFNDWRYSDISEKQVIWVNLINFLTLCRKFINAECLILLFILLFNFHHCLYSQAKNEEKESHLVQPGHLTADDFYENGLNAYNNQNYPEAIEDFNNAIVRKPSYCEAYYFKGLALEQIFDYPLAVISYETAIKIKPDFNEALFNVGILYYKMKNYTAGIEVFQRLLTLPPGATQAIFFRGITAGENDSRPAFNEIISMSSKQSDIYNYLGLCYWKLNNNEQSIENFSKSIQLNESDDNVYVNRGLVYAGSGQPGKALDDYNKALSINPENSLAKFNRLILKSDSASSGLDEIKELLHESDDPAGIYAYRAFINYMHEKYEEALRDYDSAILLDKNNSSLYLNRGMVLEKTGSLDAAMKDFVIAGLMAPDNPDIYFRKGNIYFKMKNFYYSISMYSKAIGLDSIFGRAYYNRALSYYNIKDQEKACNDAYHAVSLGITDAGIFIKSVCEKEP